MYTKEQIEIALKEYERLGSVQAVINLLEYPSSSTLYRWRPHYDCSSFVITAYQNSGVPVKDNGMTYTRKIKITHSRSTTRNTSERGICSRRKS